jgi:hypothetical protein
VRAKEFLTEGVARYRPMFNMFKGLVDEGSFFDPGGIFDKAIEQAEHVFKRQDRIIWALRWRRLAFAETSIFDPKVQERAMGNAAKAVGMPAHEAKRYADFFFRNFAEYGHYVSLPAANVQALVWDRQNPKELMDELDRLEQEWQSSGAHQIIDTSIYHPDPLPDYRPEPRKIIDFHNGWAWYDLNIDACEIEGRAMGHCGNEQNRDEDDTVLSLRRELSPGKVRPSVTAVLHKDGYLGEIKGRANKKPKADYFPYIVRLLKDRRVKGIRGGGHDPLNNFSIFDLPENEAGDLLAFNSNLASIVDTATYWNDTKSAFAKGVLDDLLVDYFASWHGHGVERVDTDSARIICETHDWQSDWTDFMVAHDRAPSNMVKNYWNRNKLPRTKLFWKLVEALVPFDKSFNLQDVTAAFIPATKKVEVYLPYEGVAHAFSDNMDNYCDDGHCTNLESFETMADEDTSYDLSDEERFKEYSHAVNFGLLPCTQKDAWTIIEGICNAESTTPEALVLKTVKKNL